MSSSLPPGTRSPIDLTVSRRAARVLDDLFTIPGTRIGVGADALVGLVPGIGDLAGSTLSGAILYDAVRCRVPVATLARMGWNLLVDALVGLIPLGGDLVDVAHRANRKNFRLLESAVAKNPYPDPPSVGYVLAALGLVALPFVMGIVLGVVALVLMLRWLL